MNDLKFTTAGDYIKDSQEKTEACYIIEGDWDKDTEEKNERTMGREVSTKNG